MIQRVWVSKLLDWVDFTAFMVVGLLAEELLFRGILFDLCRQVFKGCQILRFSFSVWITAILFGLSHLAYHRFELSSASVTQVIYTTVMGIVFAHVRETTGRLWPVVLLHMANNVFAVIRNLS